MLIALWAGLLLVVGGLALFVLSMPWLIKAGTWQRGRDRVAVELDCILCTGGVQWLGRNGWRKPWESAEAPFSRSTAMANSRDCPCCTGMGAHVYHVDDAAQAARLKAPCEVK